MACDIAAFSSMEWNPGGHPLEQKKVLAERGLTLLRFDVGFEDPNWCTNGHIIYVVRGRFELTLDDGTKTLDTADACVLDPGTKHRAKNPGNEPVELFVAAL